MGKGPFYYEAQERAMAPGISGEWPLIIPKPGSKNGRLVRVSTATGIKDLKAFIQDADLCFDLALLVLRSKEITFDDPGDAAKYRLLVNAIDGRKDRLMVCEKES